MVGGVEGGGGAGEEVGEVFLLVVDGDDDAEHAFVHCPWSVVRCRFMRVRARGRIGAWCLGLARCWWWCWRGWSAGIGGCGPGSLRWRTWGRRGCVSGRGGGSGRRCWG